MNFKKIIKEEWKEQFYKQEIDTYDDSLFSAMYEEIAENMCIRVWNSAIELAAERAMIEEHIPEEGSYNAELSMHSGGYIRDEHYVTVCKPSILKLKIDGKTNTTEV